MAQKLTPLELQIMEALWRRSPLAIREIQEAFPPDDPPAYTTVQTTVYRLEAKKALRRTRKIGNAHLFEPVLSRTLGIPLFQEQLLRIAMITAGFSGGEAEELRRALGFKRSERRMKEVETKLRLGMEKKHIALEIQERSFGRSLLSPCTVSPNHMPPVLPCLHTPARI